jgi:hypothetical protein
MASHDVATPTLEDGLKKAFDRADEDFDNLRSRFLDLTLWHIYARDGLWIGARTPAGNVIPADVLVAAYTMWRNAMNFANNRGVDFLMASSAMEWAAHLTADNLAKGRLPGNVRKYMFGIYRHRLARSVGQSGCGFRKVEFVERRLSDLGSFSTELANRLFSREMLRFMPPQSRKVAQLRHYFGCGWPEIASVMGISVFAARKALSVGLRKARERYARSSAVRVSKKRVAEQE